MLTATNLHKSYRRHKNVVTVLRGLDLDVRTGEFLSIIGASGSGKSTLLHLLGTLDQPDSGEIHLDDKRIDNLPGPARDALRNRTFGYVFQFYHLLPELSALENVLVPAMIDQSILGWWGRRRELNRQAAAILDRVGLGDRVKHKPREMSGGEMQRTAIARALISRPRVLLADEPTGNLDEDTGTEIIKLLRSLNRDEGLTIVMVTHNLDLVAATDRVVRITAGRIEAPPPLPDAAYSLFSEAC
jgi:lipoprotein-releasing system ATP-binding protein